jgi:threonine synthase
MQLYSTNNKDLRIPLSQAVVEGLAPDGGLYMPIEIPQLPKEFFVRIHDLSFQEIAYEVAKTLMQNAVPDQELKKIVDEAINFDAPIVEVESNTYALELFHGPTLAFKDFGARFMSRLMSYFTKDSAEEITILVATSGDTGSAVASGFLQIPGIKVIILYPSGKVSHIQEMQLTTMGYNIQTLEVDGVFDDCQALVKQAFVDPELKKTFKLSSANSINIARLIPQSFYYFYAYSKLPKGTLPPVFSVPSGNFGNLTAGLFAKQMGLPIKKFIAATNSNDTFPNYLETGQYKAKPSVETISNAMDVGNPSNFARMQELYESHTAMQEHISSKSYSDKETLSIMKELAQRYTLDPHGAVAYLGLKEFNLDPNTPGIFLETAHPAKFGEVVEKATGINPELPERLASCLNKEKQAIKISKEYLSFKSHLNLLVN